MQPKFTRVLSNLKSTLLDGAELLTKATMGMRGAWDKVFQSKLATRKT